MGIFKNDDKQSSAFGFDEKSMAGKAVKAVRWIYAITGVIALLAGIALLFAPAKSFVFLTTVLGFYFVITAAIGGAWGGEGELPPDLPESLPLSPLWWGVFNSCRTLRR